MDQKQEIRSALARARAGPEELLAPSHEDELVAAISPHRPSLVWDFAHIARFEELWLLRNVEGPPPVSEKHDEVHDAFGHAPSDRLELPPLRPAAARAYAADVREQARGALERADLQGGSALVRKGRASSSGSCSSTSSSTRRGCCRRFSSESVPSTGCRRDRHLSRRRQEPDEIEVPGAAFLLGAVEEPWAYDNELVPHEVELRPYSIDRTPGSNAAFTEFVEDGGYRNEKLWSPEGWSWRAEHEVDAPLHWERGSGGWGRVRFGRHEPVPSHEPVQHVSFHEADAFDCCAGKRRRRNGSVRRAGRSEPARTDFPGVVSGWATTRTSAM